MQELVGEGKKFATVEELARGKLEADKFIEQLQNENKLTREQMAELETKSVKEHTIADLIKTVQKANEKATEEGGQPISEDRLSKMVREIMDGEYEAQTKASNRARANKAVLDKVGGDVEAARSYVAERAKELNMSVESLEALSEDSPTAFLKLIGSETKTGSQSVSGIPNDKSTIAIDGKTKVDVIEGHHTKHYYDKLKEQLGPAKYWNDTKIQGQYLNDAMALGDRFNQ